MMRVGLGYDAHPLVEGRELVLGGVRIPWSKGLQGHSDADVVSHAVADALLGAAGLPDLGSLFPSSDERWRGVSSLVLLEQVARRLGERGAGVLNVDVVVVADEPRLGPHGDAMRRNLATALGVPAERIRVKAKSNEGLGFEGRSEGVSAWAVALVEEPGA